MGDAADMCIEQGLDELILHRTGKCDTREPCQYCAEENKMTKGKPGRKTTARERKLRDALVRSRIALDTWLHTYASDCCAPAKVKEAGERIMGSGGTLAYIADVQRQNLEALEIKPLTNGERMAREKESC